MKIKHRYDPWHCLEVEDFLSADRFEVIKKLAMVEHAEYEKIGVNSVYT